MFESIERKKNQQAKAADTTTTVIGQGVFIEAQSFRGVGQVRIDGVYLGEMFVDGNVIIGQTGEIRGNITANTITVAGTVSGNIICRKELHMAETAVVEGDIQTDALIVDQGAAVHGTINSGALPIAESISLDDNFKSMEGGIKSIDVLEDRLGGKAISKDSSVSFDDKTDVI